MDLPVTDEISLTGLRRSDKAPCVERINNREIYERTLRIPHPYHEDHFNQWMSIVAQDTERYGEPIYFAVRENDSLIGGIGFDGSTKGHRGEIGYWLAKECWGRGIMTAVVGNVCEYAIVRWNLVRITAHVFESNLASARVLEKNGFEFEGLLRKHVVRRQLVSLFRLAGERPGDGRLPDSLTPPRD